jgi:hypothetical protein
MRCSTLLLLWPNSAASFGLFHRHILHHRRTTQLASSFGGRILRWAETSSSIGSSMSNEEDLPEELAFLKRELTAYLAVRDQVGADEQAKQYVAVVFCIHLLRPRKFVCRQCLAYVREVWINCDTY